MFTKPEIIVALWFLPVVLQIILPLFVGLIGMVVKAILAGNKISQRRTIKAGSTSTVT